MRKLNKGSEIIIHTRIKYSILLIIPLILLIILPAVSLADANRIYKENSKAVVVVTAYDEKGNAFSQGSGFIVRRDGAVVTNYHVISKARDIKVKMGDKVFDVEGLIFTDKENDIVILKVKAKGIPVVKLGVIEKANIGEHIYVISSPVGFENTISDGLLSGIRKIDEKREILQITAPISPGSSGGPVFNRNGEVIGVVTMLIKEAQNLNFAIPVELIKDKISSKMVTAISELGLEDYEKTADYWFNLGYYHHLSSMYKDAIEAYKQAIRINPDLIETHNNLGNAYANLGMYKEVIEAYKQAIRIDPDYAAAHCNLGNAYSILDMYKEAFASYEQAIRINPDYADAHYNLGLTYAFLNDRGSALEQYKILKDLDSEQANKLFNIIYNNKNQEVVKKGSPASVFATKDSNVYHGQNCSRLDATKDLIEFPSPQQARNDGGVLCNYCNP